MKRINKFSILTVKMEGFKRFKEPYTMEFDRLTYISGANGQGKSTIADAIAYAFCGTPFWGEKGLDKLQNPECKEMSVEVQFVDENGEVHNLSRRRNGNTTTVTLDTIQLRQTDLNNIFAEKDIFLSLINPLYFIESIAENGRDFLQKLLPPENVEGFKIYLKDQWYPCPDLLHSHDIQKITGYHQTTILRWLCQEKLQSIVVATKRVVAKEWLIAYIAEYSLTHPSYLSERNKQLVTEYITSQ